MMENAFFPSHAIAALQSSSATHLARPIAPVCSLGLQRICALWFISHTMPSAAGHTGNEQPFKCVGRMERAHSRVLWAASWAPDDITFVTGSRDGSVKMWSAALAAADTSGALFISLAQTVVQTFVLQNIVLVERHTACTSSVTQDDLRHLQNDNMQITRWTLVACQTSGLCSTPELLQNLKH